MYKAFKKMKPIQKGLFSLLIGFAVVAFWRGAWGVLDTYLFPNNYELSVWFSLLIGLGILSVTHYWSKELT